jgi:serine/threonine protein kinase
MEALQATSRRAWITVGRYEVRRVLGDGGMGVVYLAHDPRLDRDVALKLLRPKIGGLDDQANNRLISEAMVMARLSHPRIVTVHDAGTFRGQAFIVMELVHGETLAEWLAREPRSSREIVEIFVEAGRGLSAAHGEGIVHGDFKLQNVLIDDQGRPKVTDFGLSRLAPVPSASVSPTLGRTRELVGTPAYMAPEQLEGGTPDVRSDQFSFCVALYEALCGERPYARPNPVAIRDALHALPTWSRVRARAPKHVVGTLRRGLSVDPPQRFPSMDGLLSALAPHRSAAPRLAGIWDPATRAQARQAVLGAGQSERVGAAIFREQNK